MVGQPNVELMNRVAVWLTRNSVSAATWPTLIASRPVEELLLHPQFVEAGRGQRLQFADHGEVVDRGPGQARAVDLVGPPTRNAAPPSSRRGGRGRRRAACRAGRGTWPSGASRRSCRPSMSAMALKLRMTPRSDRKRRRPVGSAASPSVAWIEVVATAEGLPDTSGWATEVRGSPPAPVFAPCAQPSAGVRQPITTAVTTAVRIMRDVRDRPKPASYGPGPITNPCARSSTGGGHCADRSGRTRMTLDGRSRFARWVPPYQRAWDGRSENDTRPTGSTLRPYHRGQRPGRDRSMASDGS